MNKDLSDDLKEIIEVSYKALREEERDILQLCGLHPEDSNIPIEDLTRYAWGLRLFQRVPSVGYVRGKTETCLNNLKSANLLMDSDGANRGCVKMHDLVLAFVVDTVSKGKDAWIIDHGDESNWSEFGRSESCKRISLSCRGRSEFPSDFKFPNLSLLKLIDGDFSLKFPIDFYEEMKILEVMGYERMKYPLLPTSFQCSPNLRTLFLHQCSLPFDYSCIGDLLNLEVLSFAKSDIRKLPSTFKKLEKLRLLDLTDCSNLVIDEGIMGNLVSLEELYMDDEEKKISFTNGNYNEVAKLLRNLSELEVYFSNKDALPSNMLFEKLKRFKISLGCPLWENAEDIEWESNNDTQSYANTLMLITNKDDLLESGMSKLFEKTENLYMEIDCMEDLEDVDVHPPPLSSSFRNLRILVVVGCEKLRYLFTLSVAKALSRLETLAIAKCPVMVSIIHIEGDGAHNITFPELTHLALVDLPELSCLCNNVNVIQLPHLVGLMLSGLIKFTRINYGKNDVATSSNNSTIQPLLNKRVVIPKLEELFVYNMKNLEEIWPLEYSSSEEVNAFMLRSIAVYKCDSLVNLLPDKPMPVLRQLEEIKVENCASIRTLFNMDVDRFSTIEDGNSSILRRIELRKCDRLVSPFPRNPLPLLSHLEELQVEYCPSIETLFDINMDTVSKIEDGISSVLRSIIVRKCEGLVSLFPSNPIPMLRHLEEVWIKDCALIETLFNIDLDRVYKIEECSSMLRRIYVNNLGRLREIWRVKGLNEGNIVIGGFQAVERIIIKDCKSFENVFTPANANFNMGALMDIEIVDSGECNSSRELEIDVAFPSSCYMHNFNRVHKIRLENFEGMEVVFEIESGSSSKESAKTQPQLLLPNLTNIELTGMEKMTHVWKCNWNEFLILQKPPEMPFRSLTTISMYKCRKIEYLFSPLMAKLLSSLKIIHINECHGIEEVVSSTDDINDEERPNISPSSSSISTQTMTTFFTHLDSLSLKKLSRLRHIGGGGRRNNEISSINTTTPTSVKASQVCVVPWSLCQYSRKICITWCNRLSSVIPSYALGQMQRLEVLEISCCISMIEVFVSEGINNNNTAAGGSRSNNVAEGSSGTHPTLEFPRLKNINLPQLLHLKEVHIDACGLLQHVFTFSMLESLKQLEMLDISECKAMKVIVKEENGEQTEKDVVFPCLKSIKLFHLPNLEGFFLGTNNFQWKSLELVLIYDCPKIRLFTTGHSTAPKLNFIHTSLGKHSLERDLNFHVTTYLDQTQFRSLSLCPTATSHGKFWSFHNIIEINTIGRRGIKHIIPSNELPRLQKLEKIELSNTYLAEEIFETGLEEGTDGGFINETCTAVEIPNLREMDLKGLSNLKYIRKSNRWAVLKFPNLTRLSIDYCGKLKYVFTCSMAASLSQLQDLYVYKCDGLEVIVKEEEEEKCDGKMNETITLPCLESLQLDSLSSLKGFCLGKQAFSLPELDTLRIKKCPTFTVFTKGHLTTPKLNTIETQFGWVYVREDVNSFINTKHDEGFWNEETY